jgi:hypothetical protein
MSGPPDADFAYADVEPAFCAMEKPQSATAHHSSFKS